MTAITNLLVSLGAYMIGTLVRLGIITAVDAIRWIPVGVPRRIAHDVLFIA